MIEHEPHEPIADCDCRECAVAERNRLRQEVTMLRQEYAADTVEIAEQQRGEIERLKHRERIVCLMLKYQIDVHFRVVGGRRVEAVAPGCQPVIVYTSLTTNLYEALSQAVERASIQVEDKMIRIRPCTS